MTPLGALIRPVAAGALVGLALAALPLEAQVDVRVVAPTIKDARARYGTNESSGHLILFTKLEGSGLEQARGVRMTVTAAHDEAGNSLLDDKQDAPSWESSLNTPKLWITLKSPARGASTVTVTGTLDLFVPSRDPASEVLVAKALARAGKPLVSKELKAAKVDVIVVPKDQAPGNSVVVVGPASGMEKIRVISVVRADGTEIERSGRSSGSNGETTQIELSFPEPVPPDAGIVFTLLTEKAILAVPFELKDVPLP